MFGDRSAPPVASPFSLSGSFASPSAAPSPRLSATSPSPAENSRTPAYTTRPFAGLTSRNVSGWGSCAASSSGPRGSHSIVRLRGVARIELAQAVALAMAGRVGEAVAVRGRGGEGGGLAREQELFERGGGEEDLVAGERGVGGGGEGRRTSLAGVLMAWFLVLA